MNHFGKIITEDILSMEKIFNIQISEVCSTPISQDQKIPTS